MELSSSGTYFQIISTVKNQLVLLNENKNKDVKEKTDKSVFPSIELCDTTVMYVA